MKLSIQQFYKAGLLCMFIIVMMIAGAGFAHSQPGDKSEITLPIKIEYCIDQKSDMSIEEAVSCKYLARNALPRGSLSDSTVWIRLQINQSKTDHPTWAIHIGPHFLGLIELYKATENGWDRQAAGSKIPFNDSPATLGGYVFEVSPSAASVETVYFRVQMSGLSLVLINVAALNQAGLDSMSQQFGIGIHIGAILLILAFSIFNYLIHPSRLMFRFCWLTVVILLGILGGSGILAKYVFEQLPWWDGVFFNWMVCLRLACWVWVAEAFLENYATPIWYRAGCKIVYVIVAISMALVIAENTVWLQRFLMLGFTATSLIQVTAIQKTPEIQKSYRNTLLLGYIVASGLVFLTILFAAFPTESSYAAVYAVRVVDFVTPIVLLAIVGFRNRLMNKEFDEIKTANILMNARLEYERKLVKERQVLFDMLTHELKNPLASIALAIGSLKRHFSDDHPQEQRRIHNVDQSIRNMDLIIERCSLMNQVDQNEITPSLREIDVGGIIESILQERADRHRINLDVDKCLTVQGDEYFVRIIISNLLENAIKYSPPESTVEVLISSVESLSGSLLRISIFNEIGGHGIPDADLVFTRFYRNPLAQKITGSGLGLHLVSELCRILHYSVECHVSNGKVNFTIEMPRSQR